MQEPGATPTQVDRQASEPSKRADWTAISFIVGIVILGVVATNWDSITSTLGWNTDMPTAGALGVSATTTVAMPATFDAPSTTIDPDAGWRLGACVNESSDGSVSVVACIGSTDGEIIATPRTEAFCPSRVTHVVDLENGVACLVMHWAEGFSSTHCTFDGIPLYGNVFFTDSPLGSDVTVAIVDSAFLADLQVFLVDRSWDADSCGLWHVVDSVNQADLFVAVTDFEFRADFTITPAESQFRAGT